MGIDEDLDEIEYEGQTEAEEFDEASIDHEGFDDDMLVGEDEDQLEADYEEELDDINSGEYDDEIEEYHEEEIEEVEEILEEEGFEDEDLEDEDEDDELIVTREELEGTKEDLNELYKEGVATARELKDAFDDIKSAFGLGDLFK